MFLLDLLFPRSCVGCGRWGSYICLRCRRKFIYVDRDICIYCRKAALSGLTHVTCRRIDGIDGWMSIVFYNSFIKRIISTLKYRFVTEVLLELFLSLDHQKMIKIKVINILAKQPYVQPVPLHPNRLRSRGFNQASLLTNFFMDFFYGEKVDCVQRIKNTPPQAKLHSSLQRSQNIKHAFILDPCAINLSGKTCVVVDDVVTTGSTVKGVARVLKKAGAEAVFVLSLARS